MSLTLEDAETFRPPETLVMACNERYVLPAAYALHSLGVESPGTFEQVVILGSDLSPKAVADLDNVTNEVGLSLEVRDSSSALEKLEVPAGGRMSRDAWARLLIPEVCRDFSSYMYADADVRYVGNLDPLVTEGLEDNIIAAVQDVFHPTLKLAGLMSKIELAQGQADAPYFNSGIMLVDADAWREADITAQVLRFAQDHEYLHFFDQDALNAVLVGNWKRLDSCWNVPPLHDLLSTGTAWFTEENRPERDISEIEVEAQIVHFVTHLKPWLPGYPDGEQHGRYQQTVKSVREIIAAAGKATSQGR